MQTLTKSSLVKLHFKRWNHTYIYVALKKKNWRKINFGGLVGRLVGEFFG